MEENFNPAEQDNVVFKRSHFYAIMVVFAFAAGILIGYVAWGMDGSGSTQTAAAVVNPQPAGPVIEAPVPTPGYTRYKIPTEGFYSLGPADAQITLVEFSDYQCPFCRRFHQDTYQALLNAYPGKIRFVYRNLPLTEIHPNAMSAAEAALCAGEQKAYWQYHDKLFSGEELGSEVYKQYAQTLGLDMDQFNQCIETNKYRADIQKDSDFATNLGVRSTPTFFINGLAVVGAQPLDVFKQIIDKELAGEIPK